MPAKTRKAAGKNNTQCATSTPVSHIPKEINNPININVPAGYIGNRDSERKYKRKETDALNSQIIRIDRNMDGFIQASEYEKLKAEGTVYGAAPNFSEVSRNGRADYCELETNIELHYVRNLN
jgi:hypothetical protein